MLVSRWLAKVVIVRQPDIETIAIGLDGDVVLVTVCCRKPDGRRNKRRLQVDEDEQAQGKQSGEPPGASDLKLANPHHARRGLSVMSDESSVSMSAVARILRAFAAAAVVHIELEAEVLRLGVCGLFELND